MFALSEQTDLNTQAPAGLGAGLGAESRHICICLEGLGPVLGDSVREAPARLWFTPDSRFTALVARSAPYGETPPTGLFFLK